MTLNDYQTAAQRTSNTQSASKLTNGLLGLFGEGGELADLLKKYRYQGHEFDTEHAVKELGDVLWYVAEIATGLGVTLEEVAEKNIEKLKQRYPYGFDACKSINRKEGDV